MIPLTPRAGSRVWTIHGLREHGPMEGPKVDVPAQTGGTIVSEETRFGQPLFRVQWDTGQRSGHYWNDLLCIGTFRTLDDLKAAVKAGGRSAKAVFGPQGGFRRFDMDIAGEPDMHVALSVDQRRIWNELYEPLLREFGIPVEAEQLQRAPPRKPTRKRPC